jgi:hypothetical protein
MPRLKSKKEIVTKMPNLRGSVAAFFNQSILYSYSGEHSIIQRLFGEARNIESEKQHKVAGFQRVVLFFRRIGFLVSFPVIADLAAGTE